MTTLQLDALTCGTCSVPFALENSHLLMLQRTGTKFYCPNGHQISYTVGETAMQKACRLEQALHREQEATRIARADAQGERIRREKAEAKVRRARRGVCVDCNRTFQNVQRHRASKHSKVERCVSK